MITKQGQNTEPPQSNWKACIVVYVFRIFAILLPGILDTALNIFVYSMGGQ